MNDVNLTVDSADEMPWRFKPIYDQAEIVAEVCERLTKGQSLVTICGDPSMPSRWTISEWMRDSPEVASQIQAARELGEDHIAHDALLIADGRLPVTPDTPSDPQRDKLRVDTRMKLLAKFNPKRWGEGLQLRHADADGGKLDTGPLVSELLGLMTAHNAKSGADTTGQVSARLVSEAPAALEHKETSGPAYRPRSPRVMGIEDLV